MPIGRNLGLAIICILLIGNVVPAQFALRSSIAGHVTDDAGAVIPDTPVTLVDVDRGQTLSTETNGEGIYSFDNITFGHYQVVVERTGSHYFDTSVFTAPAPDTKGNAGVGILRGPGVNNWDISLAKVFRLTERWNTEFRADFFNAFNHTQWSGVDTGFSTEPGNTFGYVTGAREARIIQFGLKVSF